jgi:cystathionine beta-lyase
MDPLARVHSLDGAKWKKYGPDVLASWVADMDFAPAPQVGEAISDIAQRGDMGYNFAALDRLHPDWAAWVKRRHGLELDSERMTTFTGALHAMEAAMDVTTEPGDGVVVFTPIYHVFINAIRSGGRRVVEVPLGPGYTLDAEAFDQACDEGTKMVFFSQPHNPTGRVYTPEELQAFGRVAAKHDLIVISDEVWADLAFPPHRHIPMVVGDPSLADRTVTIGSASKAFNLAALSCAVAHVGDQRVTDAWEAQSAHVHGRPSAFSAAGTVAAWEHGEPWLKETVAQLVRNRDHLSERLAAEVPEVKCMPAEAGYLAWLDLRATSLGDDPAAVLLEKAGIAFNSGPAFGSNCEGFARMNFATTPEILDMIIDRLVNAIKTGVTP